MIGREDALFDPTSSESIADKICEALQDTAFRQQLIEHGLEHSAKFTWDQTARRAIEGLERLHERRSGSSHWLAGKPVRGSHYQGLIDSIAKASHQYRLTSADLDAIAGCIALNECTATAARSDFERRLANSLEHYSAPEGQRVGWITTWGVRCGIASFSKYLVDAAADVPDVILAEQSTLAKAAPSQLSLAGKRRRTTSIY